MSDDATGALHDDLDLFADTAVGDVRDPYPDYAVARREAPVGEIVHFEVPSYQVYRYADAAAVLRDPATFPSRVYRDAMGVVMGPTILAMDGAEHHVHRGLIAGSFRRKALEEWERGTIAPTVHALIDRIASRGEADLVRDLAAQLPIRVIARMLGIPSSDHRRFARLSIELISIAVDFQRGMTASRALGEYLTGIIEERRRDPQDDLISELASAEVDGRRLDDEHILGFLRLLLPAGAETTYRLIGTLLFALLREPANAEAVRADRSLVPAAIEESLRWEAPVQFVAREVAEDTELAEVRLPKGAMITLALGSANRDETVFEQPDEYDLFRDGPAHLSFAEGPHRCLGEHLARLETTVALNAVLDRLEDLRLDPGDRDPHVRGLAFRSPTCVPVRFRAAP